MDYVKLNVNAGDYDTLQSEVLNINCEDMMNMSMNVAWQYFFTKFDTTIKHCIPLTNFRHKFKNVYTNKDVLRLSKKKTIFWNDCCRTLSSLDYERFAKVHNKFCSLTRRLKSNYEVQTSKQILNYFGNMLRNSKIETKG